MREFGPVTEGIRAWNTLGGEGAINGETNFKNAKATKGKGGS